MDSTKYAPPLNGTSRERYESHASADHTIGRYGYRCAPCAVPDTPQQGGHAFLLENVPALLQTVASPC